MIRLALALILAAGPILADPSARLAARFAGKEAVMKSLGMGWRAIRFRDVEITGGAEGDLVVVAVTDGALDFAVATEGARPWSADDSCLATLRAPGRHSVHERPTTKGARRIRCGVRAGIRSP